jgi:hypothetical protein
VDRELGDLHHVPDLEERGARTRVRIVRNVRGLSFVFVWRFIQESKGRELEDSDSELAVAS